VAVCVSVTVTQVSEDGTEGPVDGELAAALAGPVAQFPAMAAFLSAVAVFGSTRVAVGLRCREADPFHVFPQQAAARRR